MRWQQGASGLPAPAQVQGTVALLQFKLLFPHCLGFPLPRGLTQQKGKPQLGTSRKASSRLPRVEKGHFCQEMGNRVSEPVAPTARERSGSPNKGHTGQENEPPLKVHLLLDQGPLWPSGEAYGPLLRILFSNAYKKHKIPMETIISNTGNQNILESVI